MSIQPSKNNGTYQKPRSKIRKKRKPTVSEIIKKNIARSQRPHPKYGSSKLEDRFAKEFLDKLGLEYQRQYYAESIKRYYDFYLPKQNLLLEIDGDYYHSYGKVHEEMSPMQKKNARVDEIKNEWARERGIPLVRFWEHDINNNPGKVMEELKKHLAFYTKKMIIEENKKKRH